MSSSNRGYECTLKTLLPDMTTLPDKTRGRFKVTVFTTLNQFFDEDKS
jgi:hypothetical protein